MDVYGRRLRPRDAEKPSAESRVEPEKAVEVGGRSESGSAPGFPLKFRTGKQISRVA